MPSHTVFKGFGARGKTYVGWLFAFKLPLMVNSPEQIVAFMLT
ncbi:hypothetical protein H0X06_00475 [Candidatus Dependentiae bacterium]|nr:hypothetical protein [Candidatus Dependentiae bacterium]